MRTGIVLATVVAVLVGVSGLLLKPESGGSESSAAASGPAKSGTVKVGIVDYDYMPANVTVTAGSKVSWTNEDSTVHNAVSRTEGEFATDDIEDGKGPQTVTFDTPGTFKYYCTYHAFMNGTVTVTR